MQVRTAPSKARPPAPRHTYEASAPDPGHTSLHGRRCGLQAAAALACCSRQLERLRSRLQRRLVRIHLHLLLSALCKRVIRMLCGKGRPAAGHPNRIAGRGAPTNNLLTSPGGAGHRESGRLRVPGA